MLDIPEYLPIHPDMITINKKDVVKMNSILINNINELVGEKDTLYILGDFVWNASVKTLKEYREKIKCKNIVFIVGNHDSHKRIEKVFPEWHDQHFLRTKHEDKEIGIHLNHYPMVAWRASFHGTICLHGHSHGNTEPWRKEHMPGRPLIDVGVDVWNYFPVSLEQILNRVEEIKAEKED
jgi:calcineurin-like phosphoesterase family protein